MTQKENTSKHLLANQLMQRGKREEKKTKGVVKLMKDLKIED